MHDEPPTGEPDSRVPDSRVPDSRVPDSRGPDSRGPDSRGPDRGGAGGRPTGGGQRPTPPPQEAWHAPVRVEPVPGTGYGLAILGAPPTTSGPTVGALVAGTAAVLVALVVTCLGLAGAADGWGGWVAGAFAVLAVCLGLAGVGLGLVGIRHTRTPGPPAGSGTGPTSGTVAGRGMAVAGLVCGAVGIAITGCALGAVLLIQLA